LRLDKNGMIFSLYFRTTKTQITNIHLLAAILMFKNISQILLLTVFVLIRCHSQKSRQLSEPPKREFRAAWVATVDNIDWPKKGQYDPTQQRNDFIRILDQHKRSNMNAIVVQVRNACDVYYAKSLEPWSEFLTGTQGRYPYPFYDPLAFMIEEAHARNMEFHAWFNLNRVILARTKTIAPDHISRIKPEWLLTYNNQKILNFGIPEVRDYIAKTVDEVVRGYDIDGVHFDDYFYPYPVKNEVIADEETFRTYGKGFNTIQDWRRNNVDLLIAKISETIRNRKHFVKFGISPFPIWQNYGKATPLGSKTHPTSTTTYNELFADTRKWLEKGWIDYIVPQVYFDRQHAKAPYQVLTDWWAKNSFGRHLYIGHGVFKNKDSWSISEVPTQLRIDRKTKGILGGMFFSSKSVTENYGGFQDTLRVNFYRYPALIPTMPWKDNVAPLPPARIVLSTASGANALAWQYGDIAQDGDENTYFALYRFSEKDKVTIDKANYLIYVGRNNYFVDTEAKMDVNYTYLVTSFDRLHNESKASTMVKTSIAED